MSEPQTIVVTGQRLPGEGLKPAFRLVVDGADRTGAMADRLLSIRLSDGTGAEIDTLEVTLDDSMDSPDSNGIWAGGAIETPRRGAWIEVSLGYTETGVQPMGRFVVDEVELSGPTHIMTIRARAADVGAGRDSTWKEQKTRSHQATTIGALVALIAGEHGARPAVSAELAGKAIAALEQTNESDLHLLTRLARREDATFSVKGGRAVFVPAGTGTSASGAALGAITITPKLATDWRMTRTGRASHGKVRARWRDRAGARTRLVEAGSGTPARTLRPMFGSEDEARRAAEAELSRLGRAAEGALELSMSGRADLSAGGRITLEGFRDGLTGDWIMNKVEHTMDWSGGGYTCRIEGERPRRGR